MILDPTTEQLVSNKPGVFSIAIKEKVALFTAYMPYVKGGGLFIPTNKPFNMSDEVFMLLSLMEDSVKLKVVGKVVWVCPVSHNTRQQGVGVQFSEKNGGEAVKKKIETVLGSALKSTRSTNTMQGHHVR